MADAAAIAGFFGFIASFGLLDILISKFSEDRGRSGRIAATAMTIMFIGGSIAFLLSVISAIVLATAADVVLYVAVNAFVYFFQSFTVFEFWFYSNSNSKNYAIAQFIIHLLFMGIRFAGVPLRAGLLFFVLVAAFETIAVYLSAFLCYKTSKVHFEGKVSFDKEIAAELIRLALPMVAMGFATTIYMKVDQIMVGKMMGNRELGIYSVAVALAEYWYFVPNTIYSSFLPILTERYKSGEGFKKTLQQFTDIMMFIGYAAVAVVMVCGKFVVGLLYGNAFIETANILIIYIWSGIFTCLAYSSQAYYIIHKDTKTIMWLNLTGALINFILNYALINMLGSKGAGFATLFEYMLVAFGQMVILRNKYGELYRIQFKGFFPFIRVISAVKHFVQR